MVGWRVMAHGHAWMDRAATVAVVAEVPPIMSISADEDRPAKGWATVVVGAVASDAMAAGVASAQGRCHRNDRHGRYLRKSHSYPRHGHYPFPMSESSYQTRHGEGPMVERIQV